MRLPNYVVAALAVALALAGVGCAERGTEETVEARPSQRELPASVAITARGGTDLRLESTLPVTVSSFEPEQRELRLLTFGLAQFAPLADGRRVRLAVDLAGVYDGPGRYEFGGGSSGSNLSSAFLHVVELKDADGPLEGANVASAMSFHRIVEPCAVDIDDDERSGRLSCPRLAAEDGSEIDLQFEWEAE